MPFGLQDCAFGVLVVMMISLRSIEYDYGQAAAAEVFSELQGLLKRLEPWKARQVERVDEILGG